MQNLETDILVVGAGGAGLRAALSAREAGPDMKITVASRGRVGKHGVTAIACSDRMAFHVSFPSLGKTVQSYWEDHARDIYEGGLYVSDPNLADLLAQESVEAYRRLAEMGVPFVMGPGNHPRQFVTDGSKQARACYTGPYTARDIEKALLRKVVESRTRFLENVAIVLILKADGVAGGAVFLNEVDGEPIVVNAKAVILATGGPGRIYSENVYPDGMDALPWYSALRAGAKLVNTEFIQFGLTSPATSLACSGSLMRALPMITADGRDLLRDVHTIAPDESPVELLFNKGASWPMSAESPSRAVDIAVWHAMSRGEVIQLDYRTNPGYGDDSYLSRHVSEVMRSWYKDRGLLLARNGSSSTPIERLSRLNPQVIQWFNEQGIDLHKEPFEIRHAAQHFQGGILINTKAETGVAGLYACGEAAGGQHGANRPGGNALMDCQVMGHVAGTEAVGWSEETGRTDIGKVAEKEMKDLTGEVEKENGIEPGEALGALQNTMYANVGVVRTPAGLGSALEKIGEMLERGIRRGSGGLADAISALAGISVGHGIAKSAANRRESRGSHMYFRDEDTNVPVPRKKPEDRIWNEVGFKDGEVEVKSRMIPVKGTEDDKL